MAKRKSAKKPAATGPRKTSSSPSAARVAAADDGPQAETSGGRWTFLTNHSHVWILLARNPSMVLREVAALVGITERAVQRIIADLEAEGFIEREKVGRQNNYKTLAHKHLRHPIEAHRTIGDLLRMIDDEP